MKTTLKYVKTIGKGLFRPEGIMAADDGSVYTADMRGCCARIEEDGAVSFFGRLGGVPNGICLDREGRCIVANIGNGEVQRLCLDGSHSVLMTEAEGRRMPSPNFPFVDSRDRLWVSNSTERPDVDAAIQDVQPDGCIVLIENETPRIAAEGICFANGIAIDPEEQYLYVAETMQRRILRYVIGSDGSLSAGEVYGPQVLAPQGYPDGIAFDEAGQLWVAFPFWNAIGYLDAKGNLAMVWEDPDRKVLQTPTNICFGGNKRKTAFIGSLHGSNVPCFEVPCPGARLIHQRD